LQYTRKDVAEVRGDTKLFRSVASESGGRPVLCGRTVGVV
jgi:hypothetical protein